MKPHRRLPRAPRKPVRHATGRSTAQLMRAVEQAKVRAAVTPGELERDVLTFLATHYDGRHLSIDVAQLGLSNVAAQLVLAHLRSVA